MTTKALVPLVLRDVALTIGTDDYKHAVKSVTITPSASPLTWDGLGGQKFLDVGAPTWTLDLAFVQDWTTAGSLSLYLFENIGDTVSMTFRPQSGTGPSFTVEVLIVPGAIGGSVNAHGEASVSLPMTKAPVLVPAA